MNDDVHRLTLDEVVRSVPDTLVGTCLTPRVLYHEELSAELILCDPVDDHTVVVGEFVVVKALLAVLLSRIDFRYVSRMDELSQQALLVGVVQTDPASLVGALRFDLFDVG